RSRERRVPGSGAHPGARALVLVRAFAGRPRAGPRAGSSARLRVVVRPSSRVLDSAGRASSRVGSRGAGPRGPSVGLGARAYGARDFALGLPRAHGSGGAAARRGEVGLTRKQARASGGSGARRRVAHATATLAARRTWTRSRRVT